MSTSKRSLPVWVALLGSGLAGSLVAVQSRINGGLSQRLGDGYVTALVSFGVGLVILGIVLLLSPRGRRGFGLVRAEISVGRLPVWALVGGVCGAFFVVSQGLVATVLGLALFTVGVVAGQVLGGLVMDRLGVGPGGRVDPSPQRVVGMLLVIAAIVLSMLAQPSGSGSARVWLVLVPVAVGIATSFQFAVNGLLRAAAKSAITATFISFFAGTVVLVIAAAASVAVHGWPTAWPSEPWYYVGGALGTIFIALSAMLVRTAGVLLLSMSNVAGQLLASVALEAGVPLAVGVTGGLLAGASVALVAVFVAAIPSRKTD